jgi:hypothetical protein
MPYDCEFVFCQRAILLLSVTGLLLMWPCVILSYETVVGTLNRNWHGWLRFCSQGRRSFYTRLDSNSRAKRIISYDSLKSIVIFENASDHQNLFAPDKFRPVDLWKVDLFNDGWINSVWTHSRKFIPLYVQRFEESHSFISRESILRQFKMGFEIASCGSSIIRDADLSILRQKRIDAYTDRNLGFIRILCPASLHLRNLPTNQKVGSSSPPRRTISSLKLECFESVLNTG